MQAIMDKHPSVKQTRVIGLFGAIDLQKNSKGARQIAIHVPSVHLNVHRRLPVPR